jgi:hypothetical protein
VWDGEPSEDIRALQRAPRAVLLSGERAM